ncbi:MAG: YbbC/YhhH family protein [Flavobacteriales bacterium]|nr:YbbC/YhhH family protein [Flavobacteriales bacterium]
MKKNRLFRILGICTTILLASSCEHDESSQKSDPKIDGYIPDEKTAIAIAEAIWLPIYGEQIYEEKPFQATIKDDSIWVVSGTLDEGMLGGTVYAEINKKDCKVLVVTHFK